MTTTPAKPRVAVHKFSSCDGCQLAFLTAGEALLTLAELVEIRHFAEAGALDETAQVEIAFVEGSISTPDEAERIHRVRAQSRYLVTIGACATAGGIQSLRNLARVDEWTRAVYASPEYIRALDRVDPIAAHVSVDFELWGCPVNTGQVTALVRDLLFGVAPRPVNEKVCLECKRAGNVCVLVASDPPQPCLGPVTRTGCGAICPRMGRDCYGCYGPAEQANTRALNRRLRGIGLLPEEIARRYQLMNAEAPEFAEAARHVRNSR
ncbi:MAG TPA: sulfhydrogenase subunit delta [Gammaproteobacteria bacterium]|nr:sulfhydrogenase subunit delta [Gammaproteobacteria bacterium]MCH78011.1 sulfhydrogenase subunit delta [Gammaproteobacteria bacterium]